MNAPASRFAELTACCLQLRPGEGMDVIARTDPRGSRVYSESSLGYIPASPSHRVVANASAAEQNKPPIEAFESCRADMPACKIDACLHILEAEDFGVISAEQWA